MAYVRIGSWEAFGGAGMDGFYMGEKGLVGLTGGVGVRRDVVPRAQAHGDFSVPTFREARYVTLSGPVEAPNADRLDWHNRQFTGLMSEGSATVVFDTPGGPLWAVGELATDPEFDITIWGERADWMLPLYFPNPRLFGETHQASGVAGAPVVSINYGNFPATSTITVTGDAPAYTITGPGGLTRSISTAVSTGNPHVIDMATGYIRNNSGFLEGVSAGSTWAVPGGAAVAQALFPVSGSASMSVATKATYI